MTDGLLLSARHRRTLVALLREHLPDVEAWAYGSRVNGRGHAGSDLDLVLRGPQLREIPLDDLLEFEEAVRESNIPFLVEARDWARLPERFRQEIERGYVAVGPRDRRNVGGGDGGLFNPTFSEHWRPRPLYAMATWVNGLAFRKIQFSETGWPIIKIAELKGGVSGQTKFTRQTFDEAVRVRPGDLLFSWSGQPETSIDAFWWRGPEGWLNQHVFRVTPEIGLDVTFFYYLLRYLKPNFVRIARNKQTTGLGHVTKRDLKNLLVASPDRPEQRAIAHVLGTLDDKIELNRRMNETLEAMARALFKSWFVDFDPVRAKMQGRDTGLPDDIADLFPDRLVDSELGGIPDGWEVMSLGDLVELAYGKPLPKRQRRPGRVPVYGSNGRVGWHDQQLVDGPGVVVGRKGNPGLVRWSQTGFFPIDTTFYVVPKDARRGMLFLFHLLRTQDLPSIASDSAVPGMNRNLAYMNRAVVPSKDVVGAFTKAVEAISARQYGVKQESRTLAAFRDALLPKLISGEIRVPATDRGPTQ